MCDYPFILDGDPNRTRLTTAGDPTSLLDYSSSDGNKTFFPRVGTAATAQRNINKSFSTGGVNESALAGKGAPIIRQADALDENRIVLYKKGK